MNRPLASLALWAVVPVLALAACGDLQEPTSTRAVPDAPRMHGDGSEGGHSHGRFFHITWAPRPDVGTFAVEFTYKAGFRRNGYWGSAPDGYAAPGDIISERIGGTAFNFGDGSGTGMLRFLVTSVNVSENWLFAVALHPGTNSPGIVHTYPGSGPYTASSLTCCRIGGLNNHGSSYGVRTTVTPGSGNRSPVSNLVPIVNVAQGGVQTWTIPASDADGDALRFVLPSPSSVGLDGAQPSDLTIDPNTGQVSFDTNGKPLGLYWTQQLIQELDQHGTVKGQVGIDYLVRVVTSVPNNTTPILGTAGNSSPVCGTTQTTQVGATFNATLSASDPDASDVITLTATGLPPGATATTATGNPVTSTFTWTPTAAQAGPHIVTYTATDQNGAQALCSFTINVVAAVVNQPPVANAGADQSVFATDATGATVTLNGSASSDPDGSIASYSWGMGSTLLGTGVSPSVQLTKGTHTITLTVVDDDGANATDQVVIQVKNNPPTASAGADQVVECTGATTSVALSGSGTDVDGTIASYRWLRGSTLLASTASASVGLTLGSHALKLVVTDNDGASADDEMQASVVDRTAPSVTVGATPATLWSPNHKYYEVAVASSVNDACDTSVAVGGYVESNEADDADGVGDGQTTGDVRVTRPDGTVLTSSNSSPRVAFRPGDKLEVRSERQGTAASRTYTISLQAKDASGNATTRTATVAVSHDQR